MKINEIFQSINGEITAWHGEITAWNQGSLTTFVRFSGCNLACSYCDAKYADKVNYDLSSDDLLDILTRIDCHQITFTGGEPTLQDGFEDIVRWFAGTDAFKITIETNGTYEIFPDKNISWVIDYKFNYASQMVTENFDLMTNNDWLKFVIDHPDDLNQMVRVFRLFPDLKLLNVVVGTTGKVPHAEIVDFLIHNKLYNCILNFQTHKEIWKNKKEGQKIL